MANVFIDHGLATGADDGTSWEDAYQSVYTGIQALATTDVAKIKEHAGIDCTSFAATANSAFYHSTKTLTVECGYDSTLTGTTATTGTDQTGTTVFDQGTNTRRCFEFSDCTTAISGITVDEWDTAVEGSGLKATGNSLTTTLTNCTFDTCSTSSRGGAVVNTWLNSHNFVLDGCAFSYCSADLMGGAIFQGYDGIVDATDCTFVGCTALEDGGAIRAYRGDVDIDGCSFTDCESSMDGGALYVQLADVDCVDCDFSGCEAEGGGAIFDDGSPGDIVVDGCTFYTCVATTGAGGAINAYYGTLVMSDTEIRDCTAATSSGGLRCYRPDSIAITNTVITGNTAGTYGGGAYLQPLDGLLTLTDVEFSDNEAGTYGGGFVASGHTDASASAFTRVKVDGNTALTEEGGGAHVAQGVDWVNCVVTENTSADEGGGVYVWMSTHIFTNCTIADNESTDTDYGGLYVQINDVAEIYNSIVYGNVGLGDNVQIYAGASGGAYTGVLQYSDVEGLDSFGVQGGLFPLIPGTGCIDADPLFAGVGADPYRLSAPSGAVDNANSGVTNYPSTDYFGRSRINGPDMGAYEYGHSTGLPQIHTREDYTGMLLDLLPPGIIWRNRDWSIDAPAVGDRLTRILYALAGELWRLEAAAWSILNQTDPGLAEIGSLLEDWEDQLGLPESCYADQTLSESERQAIAREKYLSTGQTTTEAWFIAYAAALGFTISIVENPVTTYPAICGAAICGEATCGGTNAYSNMTVTITAANSDISILQCALNKAKQAHVIITWVDAT